MMQKEVILFKFKHKSCDTELRLKLCRNFLNKRNMADMLEYELMKVQIGKPMYMISLPN